MILIGTIVGAIVVSIIVGFICYFAGESNGERLTMQKAEGCGLASHYLNGKGRPVFKYTHDTGELIEVMHTKHGSREMCYLFLEYLKAHPDELERRRVKIIPITEETQPNETN